MGAELRLSLQEAPTVAPDADEVVIRVEAAPTNPPGLGLLVGPADMATAAVVGNADSPFPQINALH